MKRINKNCILVSRTGEPVYPSCQYCELRLRNCLQFRGQIATALVLLVLMLLIAVPIGMVERVVLALVSHFNVPARRKPESR